MRNGYNLWHSAWILAVLLAGTGTVAQIRANRSESRAATEPRASSSRAMTVHSSAGEARRFEFERSAAPAPRPAKIRRPHRGGSSGLAKTDGPTAAPTGTTAAVARPRGGDAMRAAIDPESGALTAPAGDPSSQVVAAARNRPAPVYQADGSVRMETRWLREYSVVRLGPDGRARVDCVDGPDAAQQALKTPVAPAVEEE